MKIVETDNFCGDYPNEKFVNLPRMSKEHAMDVARVINGGFSPENTRYWKVVNDDYKLVPGFEP